MTDAPAILEIRGLHAATAADTAHEILQGIDLSVAPGEVHALMGPNGSGKSTLGNVLGGKPGYEVTAGTVTLDGADLFAMPAHERARSGLFVAFQYPVEVPGVPFEAFYAAATAGRELPRADADSELDATASRLGLDLDLDRAVNDDMSGGEKKRSEILQLATFGAEVAILDEIDSGLDVDGIRQVAAEVLRLVDERSLGVVLITHYVRILRYIPAEFTHVLLDGRIVESGGPELADELEASGYDAIRRRVGIEPEPDAGADDIFSL